MSSLELLLDSESGPCVKRHVNTDEVKSRSKCSVMSRVLGYPMHRLGLVVLESRGSGQRLQLMCCAGLLSQSRYFELYHIYGYMRSLKVVGKLQSQGHHGDSLLGTCELRVR